MMGEFMGLASGRGVRKGAWIQDIRAMLL